MQTEVTAKAAYTLTIFGGTLSFTTTEMIQTIGLLGMFAGLAISIWSNLINKQRTKAIDRANDLKERELNAKDD